MKCFFEIGFDMGNRVWDSGMEKVLHFVCRKDFNTVKFIYLFDFDHFSIFGANSSIHSIHSNLSVFDFLVPDG